jgi:hypothetical protein
MIIGRRWEPKKNYKKIMVDYYKKINSELEKWP